MLRFLQVADIDKQEGCQSEVFRNFLPNWSVNFLTILILLNYSFQPTILTKFPGILFNNWYQQVRKKKAKEGIKLPLFLKDFY